MRFKIEITETNNGQVLIETDDSIKAKSIFEKYPNPEVICLTDRWQKTKKIKNYW